jgi:hypothetical protein
MLNEMQSVPLEKSAFGGNKLKTNNVMSKSIVLSLFLFALSAFFANIVFAGDPIPGISIGAGQNPGGIMAKTTTDKDGKFSYDLKKGKYDITISYEEIIETINIIDKNKAANNDDYEITLILDCSTAKVLVNDNKMPTKITLNKQTGVISVRIPKGGATIGGTLTYESKVSPNSTVIVMSIDKTSLDFGKVTLGEKNELTFVVSNTNTSDEVLFIKQSYGINEQGVKSMPFSVSPSGTTSIKPGSSQTFTVTFSPTDSGSYNQTLELTNNSKNLKNPFTIVLSGSTIVTTRSNIKHIMLRIPRLNDVIDLDSKQPVSFEWTSTGLEGPYTLVIVEIKGTQSPGEAMKENTPLYVQKGIMGTSTQVLFSSLGIDNKDVKIVYSVASGDVVSPYANINISRSNIKHDIKKPDVKK